MLQPSSLFIFSSSMSMRSHILVERVWVVDEKGLKFSFNRELVWETALVRVKSSENNMREMSQGSPKMRSIWSMHKLWCDDDDVSLLVIKIIWVLQLSVVWASYDTLSMTWAADHVWIMPLCWLYLLKHQLLTIFSVMSPASSPWIGDNFWADLSETH